MALTRAEIQKAYRERQKAKGPEYLEKERQRSKKNYVHIQLSQSSRKKYNKKKCEAMRRHRQKRKNETLTVKMNFRHKGANVRLRNKSQAQQKEIENLQKKNDSLKRKLRRLNRKSTDDDSSTGTDAIPSTPNSKANKLMRSAGVSPKKFPSLRIQLRKSAAVLAEISQIKNKRAKKTISRSISGKLLRKYRCSTEVMKSLKVHHRVLKSAAKEKHTEIMSKRKEILAKRRKQVEEFLQRDDNSRVSPNKAEVKNKEGNLVPQRTLTDTMENLHKKFLSENTVHMGLSTFCRMRPKEVKTVQFTSRNSCLCTRHQNGTLLLKALHDLDIVNTYNPDTLIRSSDDDDTILAKLNGLEDDKIIRFGKWQRVEIDGKKCMRIVPNEKTISEMKVYAREELKEFRAHAQRISQQYTAIRDLKTNLPVGQLLIHLDFSENYVCQTSDEIQSAFWNKSSVTLHPIVVYFRNQDGSLDHKSFVVVSDDLRHQAFTIWAFIESVMAEVKLLVPNIEWVHYLSDSPLSQYRNKTMFYLLTEHKHKFGFGASWNYSESGHGKGVCDGIGAVAKRMADQATAQGKATIQDAKDFFEYAANSDSVVKYLFVSKADIDTVQEKLSTVSLSPIKGTLKLHAITSVRDNQLAYRETSCYCPRCYQNGKLVPICPGWRLHDLDIRRVDDQVQATENTSETVDPAVHAAEDISGQDDQAVSEIIVQEDDWVCILYRGNEWYIGRVLKVYDEMVEVTCMRRCSTRKVSFTWPLRPDKDKVEYNAILCKVQQPTPVGRSERAFQLSPACLEQIQSKIASLS